MRRTRRQLFQILCLGSTAIIVYVTANIFVISFYPRLSTSFLENPEVIPYGTENSRQLPFIRPFGPVSKRFSGNNMQQYSGNPGNKEVTDRPPSNTTHLLLSAYMRSGSTFVAMIIHKQPNVFYVHEPLWQFTMMGYHTTNGTFCDSVGPECWSIDEKQSITNRAMPFVNNGEPPVDAMLRALQYIYSCQFDASNFDLIIDYVDAMSASYNYRGWLKYFDCKKTTGKDNLAKCLPVLKKDCQTMLIILTKVMRLSVAVMEKFLIKDPNLKIIHLFRDPRAVVYSRLARTGWYPLGKKSSSNVTVTQNAISLCKKMAEDFKSGLKLIKKYPGRFMFIRYEDLSTGSIHIQQNLLDFAGITNRIEAKPGRKVDEYWRTLMTQENFEQVNSACADLLPRLGYNTLSQKSDRNNINLKHFVNSKELHFLNY